MLRYRVAHLFSLEGTEKVFTNDDEAEIRQLPREVRNEQIRLGNLVEWDDRQGDEAPAEAEAVVASARVTPARKGR